MRELRNLDLDNMDERVSMRSGTRVNQENYNRAIIGCM